MSSRVLKALGTTAALGGAAFVYGSVLERNWFALRRIEVATPNGPVSLAAPPVRWSDGGRALGPVPAVGEHADAIRREPQRYIAQTTMRLSRAPVMMGGAMTPRHIDLRAFVLMGDDTQVIPGGLTRVALTEGSLVVNSSQGGGVKDTWVLNR